MSVMELMEQWDWDFLCPNDIRLTDNCKFCNICGDKKIKWTVKSWEKTYTFQLL